MSADASAKTLSIHIESAPDVLGGEPHIRDHRIRVRDIVAARDVGGFSPEEIAASIYPQLTLAQVYTALAYYEDHPHEIERDAKQESKFIAEFLKDHPNLVRDVRPVEN